jgi:hypothetical protein
MNLLLDDLPACCQSFGPPAGGSDVMQPMAIPSVGGLIVSGPSVTIFISEPCLVCAVEEWKWKRAREGRSRPTVVSS